MLIRTLNEKSKEQHWQVIADIPFVYITNHTHLSPLMVENELDGIFFSLGYDKIRIQPIVDMNEPLNWRNMRGNEMDEHPFVVRKKPIGVIHFSIFNRNGGPELYLTRRSHNDVRNFTEKQKDVLFKLYAPQIEPVVKCPTFLPMIRKETIDMVLGHLRGQVVGQREFLGKVEAITNLEKYK